MERIIEYDEIPAAHGESIYLRIETDPSFYLSLLSKGYHVVRFAKYASDDTIFVTRKKQPSNLSTLAEYYDFVDASFEDELAKEGITKPKTYRFSYRDLSEHLYKLPFVFKNEDENCGREKFLIASEEDYENLIRTCGHLVNPNDPTRVWMRSKGIDYLVDYDLYLSSNYRIQEFIPTPSDYNTSMRLITDPCGDLLYASLKYNKPGPYNDHSSVLGYLLSEVNPLSSQSIVSNTMSGGSNVLIGDRLYSPSEEMLLEQHDIPSQAFQELVDSSMRVHNKLSKELGIICAFDYIYDRNRKKWFFLEYHTGPMIGDYCRRQGIAYGTSEEHKIADGRVRATALCKVLEKTRNS